MPGLLVACAAAMLALGSWGPAAAIDLREAIRAAVQTHPTVKRARANSAAVDDDIDEARAGYFPTFDVGGAAGYEFSTNSATRARDERDDGDSSSVEALRLESYFSLSQMLFDGFGTSSRTEAARFRSEAARLEITDAGETIGLRAVEGFLDVLRNRRLLELADRNIDAHARFLDQTRFRSRTGAGAEVDVIQAEARLARARNLRQQVMGGLRAAEARYVEATGQMPDSLEMPLVPVDAIPPSREQALSTAAANSPALQATRQSVSARRAEVDAERSGYFPQFDFEVAGSLNQNQDGVRESNRDLTALLRMDYNLFNGGADQARSDRAMERVGEAMQREAEVLRLIERDVRVSFSQLETARAQVPILQDNVLKAEQVVQGYQGQFELGRRTLQDVLDAENELFQARTSLVNAEYAYAFANFQALRAMGMLVATVERGSPGGRPVETVSLTSPRQAAIRQADPAPTPTRQGRVAPPSPEMFSGGEGRTYSLQVGAYGVPDTARRQADQLRGRGYPARVQAVTLKDGRTLHRVKIGGYMERARADQAARVFASREGMQAIVVRN